MSEIHLPIDEIWKPVPSYEGLYEVSNYGRVKTFCKSSRHSPGAMLNLSSGNHNNQEIPYWRVYLTKDGKRRSFWVHRLVAMTHIGPAPSSDQNEVGHIDNNPSNNHVSNLEWCSHTENMRHAWKTGRMPRADHPCWTAHPERRRRGSQHHVAKLTETDIPMIRVLLREGFSQYAIARLSQVDAKTINAIALGRTWRHVP